MQKSCSYFQEFLYVPLTMGYHIRYSVSLTRTQAFSMFSDAYDSRNTSHTKICFTPGMRSLLFSGIHAGKFRECIAWHIAALNIPLSCTRKDGREVPRFRGSLLLYWDVRPIPATGRIPWARFSFALFYRPFVIGIVRHYRHVNH